MQSRIKRGFDLELFVPRVRTYPQHVPVLPNHCPVFSADGVKKYFRALLAELYYRSEEPTWQLGVLRKVRFQGGSAWLVCPNYFQEILLAVSEWCEAAPNLVVEVSADPVHLNRGIVQKLCDSGLTDLTIRALSFADPLLRILGRQQKAQGIERVLATIRETSETRVGVRLLLGIPGQTVEMLRRDLQRAIVLGVHRIEFEFYSERHAELYGCCAIPRERNLAHLIQLRELTRLILEGGGYQEGESGKFALPSAHPRIISSCFHIRDVLGLGAGAVTRVVTEAGIPVRYRNAFSPETYCQKILHEGRAEGIRETLNGIDLFHEALLFGLRQHPGLRLSSLKENFGIDIEKVHRGLVEVLVDTECVRRQGDLLSLTDKGTILADNVIGNFFLGRPELDSVRQEFRLPEFLQKGGHSRLKISRSLP